MTNKDEGIQLQDITRSSIQAEEQIKNDAPSSSSATANATPSASIHGSESFLQQSSTPPSVLASDLPPIDGGKKAWAFLAVAVILEMLIWGMGNSYGAFQDYHLYSKESPLYGSSSAATAAPGTLITAGQYVAPFIFLGILNAYPHSVRKFQAATLSLSALSLLIASFHPTIASVIIFQGLLSGWSGGAFYTPAMVYLPQWWEQQRGFATGIIFVGSGLGGVIWPFILNSMLQNVGFNWTLRILSLIQIIFGSIIAYFLRPRLPIPPPRNSSSTERTGSRHDIIRRRRNLLRSILPKHNKSLNSPLGIINCLLHFMQNAAFWSVSYYIAPYATSIGLKGATPTALLATFNAASAVSYVLTGKACDLMPFALIIPVLSLSGGLLVGLLLGFAKSIAPLFAFAILYGLINGGFSTTMSPMAKETTRFIEHAPSSSSISEHHSAAAAVFLEIMAVRGLGGVVGPLISSVLYKNSSISTSSDSNFSSNSVYGSHGIGPIVVFATVLSGLVALVSLFSLTFRRH